MNDDASLSILKRLEELEKKVDHINELLGVKRVTIKNEVQFDTPPPVPSSIAQPIPEKSPEKSPEIKVHLLPLLGIVCFGMAAIFMVKLAIDSGWLTPFRQWGLIVVFGAALTALGLFKEIFNKNYRSYAAAAGTIILFISAYSSALYFNILDPLAAQVFGSLIAFMSLYLFHYFKNEMFIVICSVGTYVAPLLLTYNVDFVYLSGFYIIWAILFSRISIYLHSRTLSLIASYLGLGTYAYINLSPVGYASLDPFAVAAVQSAQFLIYAGGVYSFSIKNNSPLSRIEAWAYFPVLLFFYGTIYALISIFDPKLAAIVSLGFAGFIFILYLSARKRLDELSSKTMIESFLGVIIFFSGYIKLFPDEGKIWLLPLIFIGIYFSEQKNKFYSLPLKIFFGSIAIMEFFSLCSRMLFDSSIMTIVPAMATVIVGLLLHTKSYKLIEDKESLFLGLLHTLAILSLYRLTANAGSFAVTAAWGLYSLAILCFGYFQRQAILAKSSLVVLTVVSLKALVYDSSQSSSVNRIGALILTGAILYGAGYLFQKISSWTLKNY